MVGEMVLLSRGPGAGDVVAATGPFVVVGTHLYEATGERAEAEGARWRRVYRHAMDCCDLCGGDRDECEGQGAAALNVSQIAGMMRK